MVVGGGCLKYSITLVSKRGRYGMQKLLVGSDHWEATGVTPIPTQSEPRELPAPIYTPPPRPTRARFSAPSTH